MDVQAHGYSITVPDGWDARIQQGSAKDAITVQAATRALLPGDAGGWHTMQSMKPGDTFLQLDDLGPHPPDLPDIDSDWSYGALPLTIARKDLSDLYVNYLPSFLIRFYVIDKRALSLRGGFGSNPGDDQLSIANQVLSSLRITD